MKNLTINHNSIKQSLLSSLINSTDSQDKQYDNIKTGLLNNAPAFKVSEKFQIEEFKQKLKNYIENDLKTKIEPQNYKDDIFSFVFSPVGLGIMKKAIVFMLFDFHLYINIVPLKEIENANFSENFLSELLSSSITKKIYNFTEDYIIEEYPEEIQNAVNKSHRYYSKEQPSGQKAIIANHLEDNEYILAKLDIYQIQQSKSNTQTLSAETSFYILTTLGSYLFVTDKHLQEAYIETLSGQKAELKSKISRDLIIVETTKWLANRDNNALFDEIIPLNNKTKQEKLQIISQLFFNNNDKENSAFFLKQLFQETQSTFDNFAFLLIEFFNTLTYNPDIFEKADLMLKEETSKDKLLKMMSDFQFGKKEIFSLIFITTHLKWESLNQSQQQQLVEILLSMKEKYFKTDNDELNRAFCQIIIAKKLLDNNQTKQSQKLLENAADFLKESNFLRLFPKENSLPTNEYSTNGLYYCALQFLRSLSISDKEKLKYSKLCAIEKPLIKNNLEVLSQQKIEEEEDTIQNNMALAIFSNQNLQHYTFNNPQYDYNRKFSDFSIKDFSQFVKRGSMYSDLKSYIEKVSVDKTISVVLEHSKEATAENYPELISLIDKCKTFFEMPEVKIYVIFDRKEGIFSNDDGEQKYIVIDGEILDSQSNQYMDYASMAFILSKEFANLKYGFSKLFCHGQFRNFHISGIKSLDIISEFAPIPKFLSNKAKILDKTAKFNDLLQTYAPYFDTNNTDYNKNSQKLQQTLDCICYESESKIKNISAKEYAAIALLTNSISDNIALTFTGDLTSSIKAMIKNDKFGENFDLNFINSPSETNIEQEKPLIYDLLLRFNELLNYYLSEDYKENRNFLLKK